jgi:hypothetical protein
MVPKTGGNLVPTTGSLSLGFNEYLENCCRKRQSDKLRGPKETISQRLARDLAVFLPLPTTPYDACNKCPTQVSSFSLVRYKTNDYSVPVTYGYRDVLVKAYVDEIVVCCGSECIARHTRSYEKEDFIFDPLHYLALLERKINALDQAAPLAGWQLPECFPTFRRLLESRMGTAGKREYVQVLRLMEMFSPEHVEAAIKQAMKLGAIGFDAVKHLLLCIIECKPPRLDLDVYPYLPTAKVMTTKASAYSSLLHKVAA